tara:strand:+ start:11857 stop:12687 length:831 start_codon:yes stop_codon:yes gene_type:complete
MKFANFNVIEKITGKRIISKNWLLLLMRLIIVSCLILSASGATYWYNARGSEFDFGLLIDASASMMADDYEPTRLDAAKESALGFVDAVGKGVQLGVVTFTGTTYLKSRLTDDIGEIKRVIRNIDIESVGGTAIGDVLVTGSNLFFSEEGGDNVLVLITDGQSNVGLEPIDALPYLLDNNILVYTVGIGTIEGGKFAGDVAISKLDEVTLKMIAQETGGSYFHVEKGDDLKRALGNIAKSRLKRVSKDLTLIFLMISVVMLLLEWSLMNTKYRSLP